MINRTIKNSIITLLAIMLISSFTLFFVYTFMGNPISGYATSEYNENDVEEIVIDKIYYEGDLVKFPSKIKVGDKDINVTHIVTYPSGKASTMKVIELSEKGQYNLVYKDADNKVVYETNFMVYKELFTVNPEKSEVNLGKVRDYSRYDSDLTGAIVSLANGDKLTYNEIIDLNDNKKTDKLFSLKVLPEKGAEVSKIVFTLTDVYDSENYLTFTVIRSNPFPQYIVLMVNGPEQKPTGLELWWELEPWSYIYEGNYYRLHSGDGYGTYLVYSMDGDTEMPFYVSIDYSEKRVYFNGTLVADLDDPTMFSKTWDGFTSGLCRLSVLGGSYSKNKFNFLLTDIDGKSKFDRNYLVDNVAPEITVDDSDINGVYAVCGVPFKVPSATAFDQIDGDCKVTADVYINYGYSTQTSIYVSDGYFTPLTVRNHSIVYTAKDTSGNKIVKVINIEVKDKNTKLISVNQDESGAIEAVQGEYVKISEPIITDNNGKYSLKITAEGKYENIEIGEDLLFRPLYADTYTVKYVVKDYISDSEISYDINITSSGAKSIFDKDPIIPEYVIRNAVYKTPVMYGYRFANGKPEKVVAQVYINSEASFSGAELIVSDTFEYNGTGDKCFFGFKIDDTEKWFEAYVSDVGYGSSVMRIFEYFVGINETQITSDAKTSYTNYNLVGKDDASAMKFINPLQIFDLGIEIVIPEDRTYDLITFVFNDIYSIKSDKVILYVEILSDGGIKCYENSDNFCTISGIVGRRLTVGYILEESCFTFTCGNTVKLKTSGELGEFTEKKAYVSIYFNSEISDVTLYKVNNQPISKTKRDLAFPEYTRPKEYGRFIEGTVVCVSAFYYSDVLSPYCEVKMSVKNDNGEYITALDGTILDNTADPSRDYYLLINSFGYIYVEYEISDGENEMTSSYAFVCTDMVGPTIEIGPHLTEYKKGDTIVVGNYKVQDNASENCDVYIVVIMPDNKAVVLDGNSLKTNISGEYKIYYYAFDESKNATVSEGYTVTVED